MNQLMTMWGPLLLGQVAADSAAATSAVEVQSVWDFVVKGGPMMIPIGICSLVALTVIVERLLSLRRSRVIPPDFLSGVKEVLDDQSDDRAKAVEYCESNGSPIAGIFAVGIKRLGEPIELLEKHVQEAGERVVLKLRKYLRMLSVIAAIAPLMGLLGTIFGMIKAFQTVAVSGEALGKTELLAKGIYEAMITTAGGLMVAIPVLIGYHWISAKIDHLVSEMDQMTVEFIEEYAAPENGGVGPALQLKTSNRSADTRVETDNPQVEREDARVRATAGS
ncbi:MAG: MotA/TolQ/ExbB proton channel family protein [Planctomycetes bacterium]|nr:MotA/TolQ/ExbB proton channel family protein [Planctomycetota bacterium]